MIRSKRVLIVEDHADTAYLIAHVLNKRGFSPLTHTSRDDAAGALKEFQPDLIVLDFMMPGLSAEEFVLRCKRDCPRAKVIIVSAAMEAAYAADLFRVDAHFPKPVLAEQLAEYADKCVP